MEEKKNNTDHESIMYHSHSSAIRILSLYVKKNTKQLVIQFEFLDKEHKRLYVPPSRDILITDVLGENKKKCLQAYQNLKDIVDKENKLERAANKRENKYNQIEFKPRLFVTVKSIQNGKVLSTKDGSLLNFSVVRGQVFFLTENGFVPISEVCKRPFFGRTNCCFLTRCLTVIKSLLFSS